MQPNNCSERSWMRVVAAILFFVFAALELYLLVRSFSAMGRGYPVRLFLLYYVVPYLIPAVAGVLIGIGALTRKRVMGLVGCIVGLCGFLLSVLVCLFIGRLRSPSIRMEQLFVLIRLLWLVPLLIACIRPKAGTALGIVSAALYPVCMLAYMLWYQSIRGASLRFQLNVWVILLAVFAMAGAVFCGLALSKEPEPEKKRPAAPTYVPSSGPYAPQPGAYYPPQQAYGAPQPGAYYPQQQNYAAPQPGAYAPVYPQQMNYAAPQPGAYAPQQPVYAEEARPVVSGAAAAPDPYQELSRLKGLLDQGVINEQDFEAKKKQLLRL